MSSNEIYEAHRIIALVAEYELKGMNEDESELRYLKSYSLKNSKKLRY